MHHTVKHKKTLLILNIWRVETHTENMKNMWMKVKQKFRKQFGTSRNLFPTFLWEFQWREDHKHVDMFDALICCLKDLYPM